MLLLISVVLKPPYEVTETGWGEFEVIIKIYFNDPTERPVNCVGLFSDVANIHLILIHINHVTKRNMPILGLVIMLLVFYTLSCNVCHFHSIVACQP